MKFSVVSVLAAATGALAYPGNVTIVTEVVESYVTYCPSPTEIVHGSSTWTVTEPTTITITDCPCTITKPVMTTSSVICNTCTEPAPVPTTVPVYTNATIPAPPAPTVPTGSVTVTDIPGVPVTPTEAPTSVPTGAAAKLGFSGLAGMALIAALL